MHGSPLCFAIEKTELFLNNETAGSTEGQSDIYITGLEHDLQYLLIKVSSDSLFTVGSPAIQFVVPQSNVISEELSDLSKKFLVDTII